MRTRANDQVIGQDWKNTSGTRVGETIRWRRELRGQVTRGQAMGYQVHIGRQVFTGTKDGRPFSLVDALDAVNGCAGSSVLRPTGELVHRRNGHPVGHAGVR